VRLGTDPIVAAGRVGVNAARGRRDKMRARWRSWSTRRTVRRDRFGMPPGAVQVPGDHGLKADVNAVAEAFGEWLDAASFTSCKSEE